MKKRFLLMLIIGASFAPPVFARDLASTSRLGQKEKLSSYSGDQIVCPLQEAKVKAAAAQAEAERRNAPAASSTRAVRAN